MKNGVIKGPEEDIPKVKVPLLKRFTRRQWLLLGNLAYGNFCLGVTSSLLTPFFPSEAEKKGSSATEYGFVFTTFHILIFLTSPVFGKCVATITPKFLLNGGMFTVGICSILFGALDRSPPGVPFISLAIAIRVLEGIGTASYRTSCFAIVATEFDKVASAYAFLETMFGSGLIVGPALGGVLYQAGGFFLPFASFGVAMVLCGVVTIFMLPTTAPFERKLTGRLFRFIRHPFVILSVLTVAVSTFNIGFYQVTLEPHLRQFNLSPVGVGLVFVLAGIAYGVSASLWGFFLDKKMNAKVLSTITFMFPCVGYLVIGPVPFLHFSAKLWIVLVSMSLIGVGMSGARVCAFTSCLQDSHKCGFPRNLRTNGLVSGVMTSSISIGFFFGPTLGGYMLDNIGFQRSTFVVFVIQLCVMFLIACYILVEPFIWSRLLASKEERDHLLPTPIIENDEI